MNGSLPKCVSVCNYFQVRISLNFYTKIGMGGIEHLDCPCADVRLCDLFLPLYHLFMCVDIFTLKYSLYVVIRGGCCCI